MVCSAKADHTLLEQAVSVSGEVVQQKQSGHKVTLVLRLVILLMLSETVKRPVACSSSLFMNAFSSFFFVCFAAFQITHRLAKVDKQSLYNFN